MAERVKREESENPKFDAVFNSNAMIERHAKAETVVSYNDRKKVEIIKSTQFYTVGQVINPHKIMADELILQGIAKEAKDKK